MPDERINAAPPAVTSRTPDGTERVPVARPGDTDKFTSTAQAIATLAHGDNDLIGAALNGNQLTLTERGGGSIVAILGDAGSGFAIQTEQIADYTLPCSDTAYKFGAAQTIYTKTGLTGELILRADLSMRNNLYPEGRQREWLLVRVVVTTAAGVESTKHAVLLYSRNQGPDGVGSVADHTDVAGRYLYHDVDVILPNLAATDVITIRASASTAVPYIFPRTNQPAFTANNFVAIPASATGHAHRINEVHLITAGEGSTAAAETDLTGAAVAGQTLTFTRRNGTTFSVNLPQTATATGVQFYIVANANASLSAAAAVALRDNSGSDRNDAEITAIGARNVFRHFANISLPHIATVTHRATGTAGYLYFIIGGGDNGLFNAELHIWNAYQNNLLGGEEDVRLVGDVHVGGENWRVYRTEPNASGWVSPLYIPYEQPQSQLDSAISAIALHGETLHIAHIGGENETIDLPVPSAGNWVDIMNLNSVTISAGTYTRVDTEAIIDTANRLVCLEFMFLHGTAASPADHVIESILPLADLAGREPTTNIPLRQGRTPSGVRFQISGTLADPIFSFRPDSNSAVQAIYARWQPY